MVSALSAGEDSQEIALAGFLAALVWWLATHPYSGIYHDGIVYSVLALHWLDPTAYARDPFFSFGAQDQFSIFSPIFGVLIRGLGLSAASKFVVLVSGLFWLGASWRLASVALPNRQTAVFALLCFAIYSLNYSPCAATFVLNENFATARPFAASASLLALALMLEERPWPALAVSLLSTLLHPLVGVWVTAIIVLTALPMKRSIVLIPIAFCILFFAASSELVPVLLPMPEDWKTFLQASTRDVFTGGSSFRLNEYLFWVGVLLLGAFWLPRPLASLCHWTSVVVVACVLLAVVSTEFYPIDLVIRIQPWRALWVAISLAILVLVAMAREAAKERHTLLLAIIIALLFFSLERISGYLILLVCGAGYFFGKDKILVWLGLGKQFQKPMILTLILAIGFTLPGYVAEAALWGEGLKRFGWDEGVFWRGLAAGGGYAVLPLMVAIGLGNRVYRRWLTAALVVVAIPVTAGWDDREPRFRRWEESLNPLDRSGLPTGLSPGQVVYWPGGTQYIWFGYGTASYVGGLQMIGIVFSRDRSNELMRRWRRAAVAGEATSPVENEGDVQRYLEQYRGKHRLTSYDPENGTTYRPNKVTEHGLVYLCKDPELDWVVVGVRIPSETLGIEPQFISGKQYGYACRTIRLQGNRPPVRTAGG